MVDLNFKVPYTNGQKISTLVEKQKYLLFLLVPLFFLTVFSIYLIFNQLNTQSKAEIPQVALENMKKPFRAKTHTSKIPPRNVKFNGQPMVKAITGSSTTSDSAGGVVISGVPGYFWRDGCGPTAVSMIVGYWDLHGYPDLVPGDSTTQTQDVDQMISSHAVVESAPRSYEDYCLPLEMNPTPAPDRSELPLGDEHPSDSVADFMHTSWSVEQLTYGSSYTDMPKPGFIDYVKLKYPNLNPAAAEYSSSRWDVFKNEINSNRPTAMAVDCDGDGAIDHFITGVGYREINGYPEYAAWDTWSTSQIRWEKFQPWTGTPGQQWTVYGFTTFSMNGPIPTITSLPTAVPTFNPYISPTAAPQNSPTISITSPVNGSTIVTNKITIRTSVFPGSTYSMLGVTFFVDGVKLGVDKTAPYIYSWNTTKATKGAHIIEAVVTDALNRTGRSQITVYK